MIKLIEFVDVTKKYGDKIALHKMNYSIYQGECVALVGKNGCGKSTTINVMSNLIPYSGGNVMAFDRKVTTSYVSYKSKLGILLSPPILVPEMSPEQFLEFVCKFQGVAKNEIDNRRSDILSTFGISDKSGKQISKLSSGDQMKVALAGILIHNPELIILDEPFVHLDYSTVDFLMNLLKSIKGKKTVFITSHNIDLIATLATRLLIMEQGEILEEIDNCGSMSKDQIIEIIREKLVNRGEQLNSPEWFK